MHHREHIRIILDLTSSLDARDEAMLALKDHDLLEVTELLHQFAMSDTEPDLLVATAGEALAEHWKRRGVFDEELFATFRPSAQYALRGRYDAYQ